MTSTVPRVTVSPARRYSVVAGRRWPVEVRPAPGELLSSWLHRLAHANGVPPRYFGAVLGVAGEAWSAQLDRHLPEAVGRILLDHTSICPEELDGLCLGPSQLSVLRLRPWTKAVETSKAQSTWLQYCPTCLREDETPYFRRSWTLATRVSCFRHGCRLGDRCPSCGQGLAPFRRDRLVPQQYCVFCDASLAKTTDPANPGARRLERLIDDLLRLDTAGRALGVGRGKRKTLPERIAICPVPIGTTTSTIPQLSHRVRHDFFRRLSEGQSGIVGHKGGDPLNLWVRLAKAAGNQNGLVKALTDQLAKTARPKGPTCPKGPDLVTLLKAKSRLLQNQQRRLLKPVRED